MIFVWIPVFSVVIITEYPILQSKVFSVQLSATTAQISMKLAVGNHGSQRAFYNQTKISYRGEIINQYINIPNPVKDYCWNHS